MRLNFVPNHVFHETPQVSFFNAGVKGSNGSDVVIHHGNANSDGLVSLSDRRLMYVFIHDHIH